MLEIQWVPSLSKLVSKYPEDMPQVINTILNQLGVMGQDFMKKNTPVDSGNLRKRITFMIDGEDLYIGTNVTYAPFILTDVPPYTIRVKNKKALAWVTKGHTRPSTASRWKVAAKKGWARYAKQVTHPGGEDVLGKTERYLESRIPRVIRRVFKNYGVIE